MINKNIFQVTSIRDLPRLVHRAFDIATSGRPGPVLVDLPKDITAGTVPVKDVLPRSNEFLTRRQRQQAPPNATALTELVQLINRAENPVIYAGQGVLQAGASDLVRELAIRANIPTTTTLMGLGAFDECHPLSLRMLGMHGNATANLAMQNADLIIAIGARFDDRVTGRVNEFAPQAVAAAEEGRGGIVHFEVLPKNVNKTVQAHLIVPGDLREQLTQLLSRSDIEFRPREAWLQKLQDWEAKFPFFYEQGPPEGPLKPQRVVEELYNQVADRCNDVIITTGVGCHQVEKKQGEREREGGGGSQMDREKPFEKDMCMINSS